VSVRTDGANKDHNERQPATEDSQRKHAGTFELYGHAGASIRHSIRNVHHRRQRHPPGRTELTGGNRVGEK